MKLFGQGLAVVAAFLVLGYVSGFKDHLAEREQTDYEASVAAPPKAETPAASPIIEAPQPQSEWRDAVAAVAAAPVAVRTPLPAAVVLPRPRPVSVIPVIPKGAPRIKAGDFKTLLSNPAEFIVSKTWLGNPAGFQRFASDPARAKAYVNNPAVRAVLDHPSVLKAVMSNPKLVTAFLNSPAMRDPKTMQILASSPLLLEIANSKAVSALAEDPASVQKIFSSPQMMQWLAQNPAGMTALTSLTGK